MDRIAEQFMMGRDGTAAYWAGREAGEAWDRGERFDADAACRSYWAGRAECPPEHEPEDNGNSWQDGFHS